MLGCQNKLEASTLCETKQDLFMVHLSNYLMLQFPDLVGEKVFYLSRHHCICSELSTYIYFFMCLCEEKNYAVYKLSIREINVLYLFQIKHRCSELFELMYKALGFALLKYVIE